MLNANNIARSLILTGLTIAFVGISSIGAQAQWFTYRPPVIMDEMTPREVVHSVRRQGFINPSLPQYRDDFVVLTATEPGGRRVRLMMDVYSGRIVERRSLGHRSVQEQREPSQAQDPRRQRDQVVQRVPDQGAAIKRSVPESEQRTRATPERPSVIRREPLLPPQANPSQAAPGMLRSPKNQETPVPQAAPPQAAVGTGTKTEPRRIDMVPPAALDDVPAAPKRAPGAPINNVPPAALE
jgi:hypothetical protein